MSVNAHEVPERLQDPTTGGSGRTEPGRSHASPQGGVQPRRFVGTSMRDAYAKVRAALGPDALILEQRAENGRVEVLAALEAPGSGGPSRERVVAELRALGFGQALLSRLPSVLQRPDDVLESIAAAITCAPPPQPLCGRYRLLGPAGAGKTTALIKLAASRVLRFGRFGTALVATDRSRLAGCEQLASSAELLGIEYLECSESALPETLGKLRHMQLVLVDAAGIREPGEAEGGPAMAAAPLEEVQDLLAVPSMWHPRALQRVRRQLGEHRLHGVVLTHVDQAVTLIECVSLLAEWGLPLWWTGQGADLAAELEPAAERSLVAALTTAFDRSSLASIFQR